MAATLYGVNAAVVGLLASALYSPVWTSAVRSSGDFAIATVGFLLLTRVTGHADYGSHVLPAMVVLGTGLGLSFVPITISATNGVAASDSGLASGLGKANSVSEATPLSLWQRTHWAAWRTG